MKEMMCKRDKAARMLPAIAYTARAGHCLAYLYRLCKESERYSRKVLEGCSPIRVELRQPLAV